MIIKITKVNEKDYSRDKYICLKDLDFAVMKNKIIVTLPREIQNINESDKLIIEIKE